MPELMFDENQDSLMGSSGTAIEAEDRELINNSQSEINKLVSVQISKDYKWDYESYLSNQFQRLEYIGRGSFGTVLKCRSKIDGQVYAIKTINLKNSFEALEEAKIFAKVSKIYHPNILRYYSSWIEARENKKKKKTKYNKVQEDSFADLDSLNKFGEDNSIEKITRVLSGTLVLSLQMEYCESNLEKFIYLRNYTSNKPPENVPDNAEHIRSIAWQLIEATIFIHEMSIVHRDIRPANIFMTDNYNVLKLGDFGISIDIVPQIFNSSGADFIPFDELQKNYYKPPEMVISTKYDVYSVGIILYELFIKFSTKHERHHNLNYINEHNQLPIGMSTSGNEFSANNFSTFITMMIDKDPEKRIDLRYFLKDQPFSGNQLWFETSKLENHRLKARITYLESLLKANNISF